MLYFRHSWLRVFDCVCLIVVHNVLAYLFFGCADYCTCSRTAQLREVETGAVETGDEDGSDSDAEVPNTQEEKDNDSIDETLAGEREWIGASIAVGVVGGRSGIGYSK